MTIKAILLQQCQQLVDERLHRIQKSIAQIQQALSSETKSTAGDKHETGRAMLQLEREKIGVQLKQTEDQNRVLSKIQPEVAALRIGLGSIVLTNKANYFLAISAGELHYNSNTYYAISLESPIGQVLKGKIEGEHLRFRDSEINIIKIL